MKIIKFITILFCFPILLFLSGCNNAAKTETPVAKVSPKEDLIEKAATIHERVLTVDTHVDTPFMLERPDFSIGAVNDIAKGGGHVDFPRMKQGGLDAIFFAVFTSQGPRTAEGHQKIHEEAIKVFKLIHKAVKDFPEQVELAITPQDAYAIEKKGKRALFIGVENGYPVGNDINNVKKFYDLGARYITLCHTRNNDICDSSTDKTEHNGLSEFGKKVVKEMNKLGMLIDVSHISDKSLTDVLALTQAPVLATHSCARAICESPRNLTDELLIALKKNGGVIQVAFVPDYIKKIPQPAERTAAFKKLREKYKNWNELSDEKKAEARKEWMGINQKYPANYPTVADFVDHIDHIVKVIGVDYVGIGSDYDGGGALSDCLDVSQMGNITKELVKRGYSEDDIRKIWGGNAMRVFRQVIEFTQKQKTN